jgi:hypothetical protein
MMPDVAAGVAKRLRSWWIGRVRVGTLLFLSDEWVPAFPGREEQRILPPYGVSLRIPSGVGSASSPAFWMYLERASRPCGHREDQYLQQRP